MQPFMKNVSVEYAEKAAPGGEIETGMVAINDAISEMKEIPVLTEDNAQEIYEKKPLVLEYNDVLYYLAYKSDAQYFTLVFDDGSYTYLHFDENDYTIYTTDYTLAMLNIAGTKLYKHQVIVPSVYTSAKLIQDSTGSTTYEKGSERSFSAFTFVSTDNTPATDLYTLYDEMVRAFGVIRGHDPIYPDRTYGTAPTYTEIVLKTKNSTSYYDGTNTLTPVYIIDSNSTVTDTVTPL